MLGSLDHATLQIIVQTSPTKCCSDFVAHLEKLDNLYGPMPGTATKPVALVADNGPIHLSKLSLAALATRAHWLTIEWLPKYTPELNGFEIDHSLDRLALRFLTIDGVEEADEIPVPVALHAAANDRPVQRVERCKQRRRAMPDIIMRHRGAAAELEWQAALGAVRRLDLALFGDAQHDSMGQRRGINAHHIDQLVSGYRSRKRLKLPTRCGLRSCARQMRCTEVRLHRGTTDARCLRHRPPGPLRDLALGLAAGQRHHTGHRLGGNQQLAGFAGLVAQQPITPRRRLCADSHRRRQLTPSCSAIRSTGPPPAEARTTSARSTCLRCRLRSDALTITHTVCLTTPDSHGSRPV